MTVTTLSVIWSARSPPSELLINGIFPKNCVTVFSESANDSRSVGNSNSANLMLKSSVSLKIGTALTLLSRVSTCYNISLAYIVKSFLAFTFFAITIYLSK